MFSTPIVVLDTNVWISGIFFRRCWASIKVSKCCRRENSLSNWESFRHSPHLMKTKRITR